MTLAPERWIMELTRKQLSALLDQRSISPEWPWATNDESVIDKNFKDIIAEVRRKVNVLDKSDFGHYGSGYASFVDCWLYREEEAFRYATSGHYYYGLVVLLSRLSNFYVIGEGQKSWNNAGGSSYLPDLGFVDKITRPEVMDIAKQVCAILDDRGLKRLYANELDKLLPNDVQVPTVLSDRPWKQFDAIFYWED